MTYMALTAYGVEIRRALTDRATANAWIENEGPKFPGSRVVRITSTGAKRTIWPRKEKP